MSVQWHPGAGALSITYLWTLSMANARTIDYYNWTCWGYGWAKALVGQTYQLITSFHSIYRSVVCRHLSISNWWGIDTHFFPSSIIIIIIIDIYWWQANKVVHRDISDGWTNTWSPLHPAGALPFVTATAFCLNRFIKWFIILSYSILCLWGLYKVCALWYNLSLCMHLSHGRPSNDESIFIYFIWLNCLQGVFLFDALVPMGNRKLDAQELICQATVFWWFPDL